ncbi:MAG: chitobiase/beta-hexosaminidase C-terminal domain-containing protein, partial [Methanobacterium paludis]|nr:chitobiase/beta-hexosaminidase C-terminal domain-containing protein [Methanobacterium paludis]
ITVPLLFLSSIQLLPALIASLKVTLITLFTATFTTLLINSLYSSVYTQTYTIDTTAPVVSANVPGKLYNSTQTVTLTATDDTNTTIYYTTDGSDPQVSGTRTVYTGPITVANTTTLEYTAVDDAGNWAATQTQTYTIDTIAPVVSVNETTGAFNVSQSVALTSDDSNATIYYTTDGSDPASSNSTRTQYTGPITINTTTTLKYTAVDDVGNWAATQTQTYVIDTIAPTVDANVTSGIFNTNQSVTLNATDDTNTTIYYTTDGSDPTISSTKYTGPITISNTTTLKYLAVDVAGNMSSIYTQVYTIDTVVPTVKVVDPANNVVNVAVNKVIKVTFSEAIKAGNSWIELKNSNGTVIPTTWFEVKALIWKCGQCYSCRARCPRNCKAVLGVQALQTRSVLEGDAPSEIMDLSKKLKNNLYLRGETFLPSLMDPEILKEFGEKTYKRCKDNDSKRTDLGFKPEDARKIPIPKESLEEIREIMKLTGFMEDVK